MKQNQLKELEPLSPENFENVLNVYQTEDNMYFYNLLQTIHFPKNLPITLFETYKIIYGDTWPLISFKTLNTPNLWWIILLVNHIDNPLTPLVPSTIIKIPTKALVDEVLFEIKK